MHTILVGNCGLLPGNVLLLPEADVDDGLFDIVTLRPEGFGGWAQIWLKIFWENGVLRRSSVGRKLVARSREVRTLRYLRGTRHHGDPRTRARSSSSTATNSARSPDFTHPSTPDRSSMRVPA